MFKVNVFTEGKDVNNQFMLGGNSATDPPDSISNSEVKRSSGDGSVGVPM